MTAPTSRLYSIAAFIAGLSIPGLAHNYGLDDIQRGVIPTECPIFEPDPENYVSNFAFKRLNFRKGVLVAGELIYQLHYDLYFKAIGEGEQMFEYFGDLIPIAVNIMAAIAQNSNPAPTEPGKVDIQINTMPIFGPVRDFTGAVFHGAKFAFQVSEIVP